MHPEDPTRTIEMITAAPGAVIGPYRLIRQLGEGGMGVVYQAQQIQPIRRDVALKIIKPGMDSKEVIARFESERQALALMDHANIARVFDAGATSTGRPYFVMELVDGVPITRYCDSKRLTIRERIELFIPVCRAIQHAHQKGIIHRDIKPSNVLVAEQEGEPVPKVIDFGLATALGHQLSDATMMTNLDAVAGTFQYMSPEQAELGRRDIDTRSDVYSLGAVLYELIAGTTPLERESMAKASYVEILRQIREMEPPPPSVRTRRSGISTESAALWRSAPAQLPKLLDGELDWITMKALEKDRTRRYETVNSFARDLERYLDGEPVEAAPPSTAYRMGKFVRKHRVWLATAAAFTALLAAGVVVTSLMAVRASRAEQEARAVNDFLQSDLLAKASANNQAGPDTKPDPNLTVRTALDRAATRIEGKFKTQPLIEASIRQTIGNTYKDLGLYAEAQRQMERVLYLRRRTLGEKHQDTLASMNNLAQLYWYQGKYAKGEPLLNEVAQLQRRVLGEDHPDTLDSLGTLGVLYLSQGKYAQAEPLISKVLEARRRVLGEDHKDTLGSMGNLAVVYLRQGKYAQAEPLLNEVVELQRRVLGGDHPDTLTSMNNLAALYRTQGRYAQAEALYARVVETRRRVQGEDHPETLDELAALGRVRLLEQEYAEAEATLRQALKGNEKTRPEAWQRYYSQSMLGASLAGQGKYVEAEPLLLSGYEGGAQRQSTMSAGDRSFLAEAGERIVKLYQSWGKPDKAAEWRQKLQETRLADSSKRP
jgi:eukaryotic-like serine/threonine-protein kinase